MTRRNVFTWIVLVTSACSVHFLDGQQRAFGLVTEEIRSSFTGHVNDVFLNYVGDAYTAIAFVTTPFFTILIIRMKKRYTLFQTIGSILIVLAYVASSYVEKPIWLLLTHPVMHGLGSSMVLSSVTLIINDYFDHQHEYHLLASCLVNGGSFPSIFFIVLYGQVVHELGWQRWYLVLAIATVTVNTVTAISFYFSSRLIGKLKSKDYKRVQLNKFSRLILIIIWTINNIITSITVYGLLLNLGEHEKNIQNKNFLRGTFKHMLTTFFASGEALCDVIALSITWKKKSLIESDLKYALIITAGLFSGLMMMWEFWKDLATESIILAFASGFCVAPGMLFMFPGIQEMSVVPDYMINSMNFASIGIGAALSPIFTSLLMDYTNNQWMFLTLGILSGLKFVSLIIATIWVLVKDPGKRQVLLSEEDSVESYGSNGGSGSDSGGSNTPDDKKSVASKKRVSAIESPTGKKLSVAVSPSKKASIAASSLAATTPSSAAASDKKGSTPTGASAAAAAGGGGKKGATSTTTTTTTSNKKGAAKTTAKNKKGAAKSGKNITPPSDSDSSQEASDDTDNSSDDGKNKK